MPGNYFSLTLFCREEEGLFMAAIQHSCYYPKNMRHLFFVLSELTKLDFFTWQQCRIYDLTSGDAHLQVECATAEK